MAYKLLITVLAVVAGAIPAFSQSYSQRAVLYDQSNSGGNYIVIPGDYAPDLSTIGFDNRVRSVCVTGVWLFYQDANYNNQGSRGMEYVYGKDNYCVNILTIAGTISSVRYAGKAEDYRIDSLTLYKYDYFQGEEEFLLADSPNLNLVGNHESIIITGNSHWTVFDQPNYQGNAICLKVPEPGTSTPSFISNLLSYPEPIPHGSIRSIRKGCLDSSHTVTLQSFARGMDARKGFIPTQFV